MTVLGKVLQTNSMDICLLKQFNTKESVNYIDKK